MNSVFILLNSLNDWKPYCETDSLMTVTDYLEHRYGERTPKLVINLSDEYGYNSEGYYCSLLAQARGHRVLPGVETLNKLESGAGIRMNRNLQQLCQQWIERNRITDETWQLNIYFGTCREKGLEKIARFIFDHYPCPILRVTMNNHARNQIESVQALSLRQLSESGQDDFANALDCFNKKVWRSPRSAKPARYNLAILYDPDEKFPPSDKDALNKFLEVARKMNIHAELITEEEATRLMEFDALFIRATTALNHYTFRLAQRAAMNDIAVIDDPESIIRCTNKVYLCELFEKARIPAPASQLLFRSNEYSFGEISERLGAPFVLGGHAQGGQRRRAARGARRDVPPLVRAAGPRVHPHGVRLADRPPGRRTVVRLQILHGQGPLADLQPRPRRHRPQPVRRMGDRTHLQGAAESARHRRKGRGADRQGIVRRGPETHQRQGRGDRDQRQPVDRPQSRGRRAGRRTLLPHPQPLRPLPQPPPRAMNPAVGIRPATAGDLDAVECVERRSFPEGEAFTRRQLRYLLTHAQGASYAATRDGAVVGYISLLMRRTAQNLRIYSVAVDPAARGCGAGQALLDAAIALARRLGLREVTLEVRTDNDSAIRLYARKGFRPGKLLRGYYPDGTDARRMSFRTSCGRPE